MKSGADFLETLLNRLLPNRAAPVVARVIKSHEGPGKNKYSVDVRVLKAGTLEDTDKIISEVPLNPIWATKKKRGVYAIPPEGQVVVIEFLEWNIAYPYVSGIWGDKYDADKFSKDKFIITDGDGMIFMANSNNSKFSMKNKKESAFLIIRDFMQRVHDELKVGSPNIHQTSFVDKFELIKLINRWTTLMEE